MREREGEVRKEVIKTESVPYYLIMFYFLITSGVYVENLSEFVVRSPSEVHSLLVVGKKRLIFAETKMNRTSSR